MRGFIVYPDYENRDQATYIKLYGRLENGESFVTLNKMRPYFFILEQDLKKAEKILNHHKLEIIKAEHTKLETFSGDKVAKILLNNQEEMNKLTKELHESNLDTFEADIKPHFRFLMDNNLLGGIDIDGDYESSERINRVYREPDIKPAIIDSSKINLKVASIDIESSKETNKLFCIGIYSSNFKKVFMVTKEKLDNVVPCKNEEECLEKFKAALIDLDPDIITGWNVIDFDFDYLKKKFDKHKIGFDIGRSNENPRLRLEANFFRNSSLDIPGRLVVDGLNFIKDPLIKEAPSIKNIKFESFTLEEVSQQIIGKTKLVKGKERHIELERLYNGNKEEQQKLANYNLNDCLLVYEILEKTKMIELSIERSQLTGMPIDKITGSIASFDSLYIREARKRGLVSPTTKFSNKEERIKGGFVMSPKPGMYHNVLVLDFKSLYPSIIKTFNIDPASFIENPSQKEKKNLIVSPNGAYFKNQEGILPQIIERLHQAREKAKKEKRELSSYAIKTIQNSFFGVLASPNCRYFSLSMGNAITNFGQEIIKLTASEIEKLGYEVIYSDTDSVFVHTKLSKDKAITLGREISERIDSFYRDYAKKNYNRVSYLDLEFDKLYLALLMPQIRTHQTKQEEKDEKSKDEERKGAKKRYAGLIEEDGKEILDIVGLEAIRGDWTDAAQDFQRKLLMKIFHKEDALPFIKQFVKDLKSGKIDRQLIYRKSIRKDLKEYTKTTPPHVKAARKLNQLESNVIEYYITTDGPEPIQNLKHKIDYEHYIDKQIKPIAKTVLETLGIEFEEIISGSKQNTLF